MFYNGLLDYCRNGPGIMIAIRNVKLLELLRVL